MPYAELTHIEWSKRLVARINLASSAAPTPPPRVLGLDRRTFSGAGPRDAKPWYLPNTDCGDRELQDLVGARYGVEPKRVVLVSGASEGHFLIQMLIRGRDGGDALCEQPGYGPHRGVARAFPGQTLELPRDPEGRLVAVSLFDRLDDGISAVYTFFDPACRPAGLGTWSILWLVEECRRQGLPYVYLGYWIAESPKMAYKARFPALERLNGGDWVPFVQPEVRY